MTPGAAACLESSLCPTAASQPRARQEGLGKIPGGFRSPPVLESSQSCVRDSSVTAESPEPRATYSELSPGHSQGPGCFWQDLGSPGRTKALEWSSVWCEVSSRPWDRTNLDKSCCQGLRVREDSSPVQISHLMSVYILFIFQAGFLRKSALSVTEISACLP